MANLQKKEIIDKITENVEDKDLQMELLEDISDSFDKTSETIDKKLYDDLRIENDLLKTKYSDLQSKYISRFSDVDANSVNKEVVKNDEIEERKVIDVRSIF